MPTYEYLCKSCGERLEVVQSFSDASLTTCPACEGPLRKLFGNVGITFKGSGFYKTDSRGSSSSSDSGSSSEKKTASTSTETKSDTGSKSSESSSASTPAPATSTSA
jgi:putative FmdB family regulatory protein